MMLLTLILSGVITILTGVMFFYFIHICREFLHNAWNYLFCAGAVYCLFTGFLKLRFGLVDYTLYKGSELQEMWDIINIVNVSSSLVTLVIFTNLVLLFKRIKTKLHDKFHQLA